MAAHLARERRMPLRELRRRRRLRRWERVRGGEVVLLEDDAPAGELALLEGVVPLLRQLHDRRRAY